MNFFKKIFSALKKTKDSIASKISSLFSSNKIGEEFYEELEELLGLLELLLVEPEYQLFFSTPFCSI